MSVSTLAPDTAMVLGIASTAMPFARTPEEQAARWLRLLCQHGEAAVMLRALGVSDARRADVHEADAAAPGGPDEHRRDERDAVARVAECAARVAARRGASAVATTDILIAVMHVYGDAFDRVLRVHGTDRDTVLVLLDA
jgi:hypothetical protein